MLTEVLTIHPPKKVGREQILGRLALKFGIEGKDPTLREDVLRAKQGDKDAFAVIVREQLTEFSAGCKKLLAAPNMQLEKTADREWLVTKCKDWATKIDGHMTDLKQDKKDWQDVLKDANETATKMQATLRDKALQLS